VILIVDDDSSVTASLALLLKQAGQPSRVAPSPAEALARLAEGGYDLVLQDMNFSRQTSGEEGLACSSARALSPPECP
jgi:two-component system NtrC family response regulator